MAFYHYPYPGTLLWVYEYLGEMYSLSEKEFLKLSKKGNLIPVYREIPADLETPVSAFLKLAADSDYGYLLESVEGQEKIARFSFLGCDPEAVLRIKDKKLEVLRRRGSLGYKVVSSTGLGDPLSQIKNFMSGYKLVDLGDSLRFCGGLVGYLGYDMVRFFEDIPDKNPQGNCFPEAILLLSDTLIVFDHFTHRLKVISCAFLKDDSLKTAAAAYRKSLGRIDSLIRRLKSHLKEDSPAGRKIAVRFRTSKKDFMGMVAKAKQYIKKGDIIQVVLSQIACADISFNPFTVYRKLRSLNPSAYMFYLKFGSLHLAGSSPEMLVRCENSVVTARPIAGTRPRGASETRDLELEKELLNDAKERAEHIMLVDLGRNDLGRVCRFGSVKVNEFMRIERYSHVMHIVSEVQGRLQEGKDSYDVLRAAFPAGTVSGSPKIRAMEIIDELENARRGPYAGAVGYFGFSGNLDTCITIRSVAIDSGRAYIQSGAGIVADSKPEKEYQETLNKAKAQLEALI